MQKDDKISSSRAHDPAQWLARSKEYMHSEKTRKAFMLSSARMLKTGTLSRGPRVSKVPVDPGVTVIWASPVFGHPHSPSGMDIPCNPNLNPNPNRKGNMRREYPYHYGFGEWGCLKRRDAHIIVTPVTFLAEIKYSNENLKNPNPIQYSLFC